MPSGFYILLRNFVRVDGVLVKVNDTRYHYEVQNDYILKEFTSKSSTMDKMTHVSSNYRACDLVLSHFLSSQVPPVIFTDPQEVSVILPVQQKVTEILVFK